MQPKAQGNVFWSVSSATSNKQISIYKLKLPKS